MSAEDTAKRVKEIRYQTDPKVNGLRLDDHHIEPRFKGGNGDMVNNFALTLAEHTVIHLLEGDLATNTRDAEIHRESARLITIRHDRQIFGVFLRMWAIIEQRRPRVDRSEVTILLDPNQPDPVDYAYKHHQLATDRHTPPRIARRSLGLVKVMVAGMSYSEKDTFNQSILRR